LQCFKDQWPDLTVKELSVRHVEAWYDAHPNWGSTTKWNYVTVILASLNWAAKPTVKLIPFNPIRGYERPRKKSRAGEARVDEATHLALMAKAAWDFKQILLVLRHTGTRPSNICRATAKNFDPENGVWVFDQHTTDPETAVHKTYKKTGRALHVPLTPEVVALCKELAQKHPTGPLFRTRRGKPWRPDYMEKRFRRLREVLLEEGHQMPEHIYSYCYRHQMATSLLERGEEETLVAAVLGHKRTKVLHENYSGVTGKSKAVRDVLVRNVKALPAETTVGAGKGEMPAATPAVADDADEATPQPHPEDQPSGG
jgi:integrase